MAGLASGTGVATATHMTSVSELMTRGVLSIRPGASAALARDRMSLKQIHHLLVKEGDELVGIVSARELRRGARRGQEPKRIVVRDFMTRGIVTVGPDTSAHKAANLMRGHTIGCLIVVDGGEAIGIVTFADLLGRIGERRRHRRGPVPSLHSRVPHRKQHRSGAAW